jgi:hypothetical protein
MTTNNPSYVPIQHPHHNLVQNAQVCITYICDVSLLSYISMQNLGDRDHELWSNEHPGIDSAGPYPAVDHADAFPPTRYTSTTGNEDTPHVAIVSVHIISLHAPFSDGAVSKGLGQHRGNESQLHLDTNHPTPGIQYIPADSGPPPLEQYAPAIPVRVVSTTPLPSLCIYRLSYRASNQEVSYNYPSGNIPLPHNVAGRSRGDLSLVHSGMSVTETLKKNLASHYLHKPGSRVNDLRTRRSQTGSVKVLILLEIDHEM